jgi:hypothetical protein
MVPVRAPRAALTAAPRTAGVMARKQARPKPRTEFHDGISSRRAQHSVGAAGHKQSISKACSDILPMSTAGHIQARRYHRHHLRSRKDLFMPSTPLVNVDYVSLLKGSCEERLAIRRAIAEQCATGKIVVLKGVDLGIDINAFSDISNFPSRLCKVGVIEDQSPVDCEFHSRLPIRLLRAGGSQLQSPFLTANDLEDLRDHSFHGQWGRFEQFVETCRIAETNLRAVAREVLQDYDYYSDCAVLRFAQAERTKLHFDPNPNLENKESLRFFANVDQRPRRWTCSLTLLEAIEQEYDRMNLESFFRSESKDRMACLIKKVMTSPTFVNAPKVHVEFDPNDVWIFDGRLIAHHVLDGDRAISLTTKMTKRALPAYHTPLYARLLAIHQRRQVQAQRPTPRVQLGGSAEGTTVRATQTSALLVGSA